MVSSPFLAEVANERMMRGEFSTCRDVGENSDARAAASAHDVTNFPVRTRAELIVSSRQRLVITPAEHIAPVLFLRAFLCTKPAVKHCCI